MADSIIEASTKALIDSLKQSCGSFGLGNDGNEYKDGNNQRKRLRDFEIEKIVDTFLEQKAEDGFSVVVSHDEIAAKGYTLSAGQYFDVKIEYVPITAEEFAEKIAGFKSRLAELNEKGAELDRQIAANLDSLNFNPAAGRN